MEGCAQYMIFFLLHKYSMVYLSMCSVLCLTILWNRPVDGFPLMLKLMIKNGLTFLDALAQSFCKRDKAKEYLKDYSIRV